MKVENSSMLKKIGQKVYFGRMDGLVMEFSLSSPPSIVFHLQNNFAAISLATDNSYLIVSGLDDDGEYILKKRITDQTLSRHDANVRFLVSTNYFVDDDFCLCELNEHSGIIRRMPLNLLDSNPLVYDVDTSRSPLLAIARMGTIYTIDCSQLNSYYPFTFSSDRGEIHEKMMRWLKDQEDSSVDYGLLSGKKIGVINVEYGDPDDEDEKIEEDKYFDKIIDPRLPIRAHNPSTHISVVKLVNFNNSTLVVSASADHHIALHDFATHKKLFDSGWIDIFVQCCARYGKKMIFGGRNGAVTTLNLDGFTLQEFSLDTDATLYYVDVHDDTAAFYTSDNSVLIVDMNNMKIIDVFAPSVKLKQICLIGNNLFMLNEEFELTIEKI